VIAGLPLPLVFMNSADHPRHELDGRHNSD
jgi:hypothetical protein